WPQHGHVRDAVLAAVDLYGADGRRVGPVQLAEHQYCDVGGGAKPARDRGWRAHDAGQYRADAEHRDRLPAGAEPHPRGCDVQGVPIWWRDEWRTRGVARVRAGPAPGVSALVCDHADRGRRVRAPAIAPARRSRAGGRARASAAAGAIALPWPRFAGGRRSEL